MGPLVAGPGGGCPETAPFMASKDKIKVQINPVKFINSKTKFSINQKDGTTKVIHVRV